MTIINVKTRFTFSEVNVTVWHTEESSVELVFDASSEQK